MCASSLRTSTALGSEPQFSQSQNPVTIRDTDPKVLLDVIVGDKSSSVSSDNKYLFAPIVCDWYTFLFAERNCRVSLANVTGS